MNKIELKYRLFAGVLLQDGDVFVSNANLTNENAAFFLKKDPKNIEKFQKYPENWAEVEQKKSKKA